MPNVTKKNYTAIQKLIRHGACSVSLSAFWQEIYDQWDIGQINGRKLEISSADAQRLRKIIIAETGSDPMHTEIHGDRIEVAAITRDEKWSAHGVFEGMIQISMANAPIVTMEGFAITPPGTLLSLDPSTLDSSAISAVIVVENGAVIRNWCDYTKLLTESLKTTLAIYRGHDKAIRSVKSFLDLLPKRVKKVGFFDYDPAGLAIAIHLEVDFILVPENPNIFLNAGKNNTDRYHKQRQKNINLDKMLPGNWKEHLDWLDYNQASISQEVMLAYSNESKLKSVIK